MPDVVWMPPWYSWVLRSIPVATRTLVDLGCGRGIVGALCRIYREPARLVGVDVFEPYLEFCRAFRLYDEVLRWNLQTLPLPFKDTEFEVCTCIEVLEHLPKASGEALLEEMSRIANLVIVTTPNRFFNQKAYDGNWFQQHVSRWCVSDFRKRGYKVFGVGGLKILGRHVRYVSQGLAAVTFYLPELSDTLLAIKGFRGFW